MNVYPINPVGVGSTSYNPYIPQPTYNPMIQQSLPVMQAQGPRMMIDTVNGKESALAYNIGPNSSVILADAVLPKIWIVTTDSSGFKAVKGFKITPDEEETVSSSDDQMEKLIQQNEMFEERLNSLEERINSYGQSNIKSSWQNKSGNANTQSNDRNGSGSKGSNGGNQSDVR